jgi:hypothetical protein
MNLNEFKDGEICIASTIMQVMYVGKFNKDNNVLDKALCLYVKGSNVDIIPAVHPITLEGKFNSSNFRDVSIDLNNFVDIVKLEDLEIDDQLRNTYVTATSGIILDSKLTM